MPEPRDNITNVAFEEFKRGFLGVRSAEALREGPPLHLVDRLNPLDRDRSARLLQDRLDAGDGEGRANDGWAVQALGRLARHGATTPAGTLGFLRALLGKQDGAERAETALAVWHVAHDDAMLAEVLSLVDDSSWRAWLASAIGSSAPSARALYVLAQFPHVAARRRLDELARDADSRTRHVAEIALQLRAGEYGITDSPSASSAT